MVLVTDTFITLDDLKELKPIECPSRGQINFPCVICQDCEIGLAEETFGDGVLIETTVNSILVHLNLELKENTPMEKFVLGLLKTSLSKIVPYVQKSDYELGDLTIMITDDKKDDTELIKHINDFLSGFILRWRQLSIESNRMLKDWADRIGKQLAAQYFKEVTIR